MDLSAQLLTAGWIFVGFRCMVTTASALLGLLYKVIGMKPNEVCILKEP